MNFLADPLPLKKKFGCMYCKVCVTRQKRKLFSNWLDIFPFGLKYLFFDRGISMLYMREGHGNGGSIPTTQVYSISS